MAEDTNWSTERSYAEVLELLPHLRALGVSRVWLGSPDGLPPELVEDLKQGSVLYDDMIVDIKISKKIKDPRFGDIELASHVDIFDYRGSAPHGFNFERVSWLMESLPEKPRKQLRAILTLWRRKFDEDAKRAREKSKQADAARDRVNEFIGQLEG